MQASILTDQVKMILLGIAKREMSKFENQLVFLCGLVRNSGVLNYNYMNW